MKFKVAYASYFFFALTFFHFNCVNNMLNAFYIYRLNNEPVWQKLTTNYCDVAIRLFLFIYYKSWLRYREAIENGHEL